MNVYRRMRESFQLAAARSVGRRRRRGLMLAVGLRSEADWARRYCEWQRNRELLAKDTHERTIPSTPALPIQRDDVDWPCETIAQILATS